MINRGNTHELVGMNIKIRYNKKNYIEMKDQIQEAIGRLVEKLNGVVSSTAPNHLWDTNKDCEQLSEDRIFKIL